MGNVINMEEFRAEFERRREAKDARRKRQRQRLAGQKSESNSEETLPSGEDRIEDDPA